MKTAAKMLRVIKTRPFHILKYGWEATLFTGNYLFWKAVQGKNIKIGNNLRVLGINTFQAERPEGEIHVGDDFVAYYNCRISAWGRGKIDIGNCCSVGSGTCIDCRDSVRIGNHVLIAWDVIISDFNPHPTDPDERIKELEYTNNNIWPSFMSSPSSLEENLYQPSFRTSPIIIEDDVWIGARSIITKGVTIGRGSIVAAGCVVTNDLPPRTLAGGNPARILKQV